MLFCSGDVRCAAEQSEPVTEADDPHEAGLQAVVQGEKAFDKEFVVQWYNMRRR